jgi:flagellar motor switch protein FliG
MDEHREFVAALMKHTGASRAETTMKLFRSAHGWAMLDAEGCWTLLKAQTPEVCTRIFKSLSPALRDYVFCSMPETFRLELMTTTTSFPKVSPEMAQLYNVPVDTTKN